MKVTRQLFLIGMILVVGYLKTNAQTVKTYVDNQKYWKDLINQGLVAPNPKVVVPAAIYRSSTLQGRGLLYTNSVDVLITSNASQSENSIFINPNNPMNPLNANNSVQLNPLQLFGTSGFSSTNRGDNWTGQEQGTGGNNGGDPSVVIDNNGRFYSGFIGANRGQGVAFSDNGGTTWTAVSAGTVSIPGAILDKNHLWIDNATGSAFEGNLYNTWTRLENGHANNNEIEIVRSTNRGASWSAPVNISSGVNAGNHNQGVNIQTGPNGEVYAVWAVYDSWPSDETALGFTRSTNGGATFTNATRIISNIRGIRNTQTSKDMRVNSYPCMAVDVSDGPNRGNIYIVWTNIGTPGTNTAGSIDIYMIRSTNGGTTWSTPTKVNQDPIGNENYFPWIACDPVTGNLSVIFYSDRNVSSSQVEVFVANSRDGGNNWDDFRVSDVAFTPKPIPGLATGYFGDYLGIAARDGIVYPVWTDNRTSAAQAYVSPFVLDNPICQEETNLTLTNTTTTSGEMEHYQVSQDIEVAGPSKYYVITNGGKVNMLAAGEIVWKPGFHAYTGSDVLARIEECDGSAGGGGGGGNPGGGGGPIGPIDPIDPFAGLRKTGEKVDLGFKTYPNPTSGKFTISIPGTLVPNPSNQQSIGIYSLLGATILAKSVVPGEQLEVDLTKNPKGVYIVKYVNNGKVKMKKIVYK
ncbi:MAG TPA: hypothetical protein DCS93_20195 [Microscillaceae bacterium]|nr:hypothetical protein [Microscillaceae bacterium]